MRRLDKTLQEWDELPINTSTSHIINLFVQGASELLNQTLTREGDETDEEKIARADLLMKRLGMDLDKVKREHTDPQWPDTQMKS